MKEDSTLLTVVAGSEDETVRLAGVFSRCIGSRGRVYLSGDLGSGKTTFCRGMLREKGYAGAVKSPTFTLVEPYDFPWGQVYHFDLYRLSDPDELEYIGIDDYFSGESLCLVEWPERALECLPAGDIHLELSIIGTGRKMIYSGLSAYGCEVLDRLQRKLTDEAV